HEPKRVTRMHTLVQQQTMREVVSQVVATWIGVERSQMQNQICTMLTKRRRGLIVEEQLAHSENNPRLLHCLVRFGRRSPHTPHERSKSRFDLWYQNVHCLAVI